MAKKGGAQQPPSPYGDPRPNMGMGNQLTNLDQDPRRMAPMGQTGQVWGDPRQNMGNLQPQTSMPTPSVSNPMLNRWPGTQMPRSSSPVVQGNHLQAVNGPGATLNPDTIAAMNAHAPMAGMYWSGAFSPHGGPAWTDRPIGTAALQNNFNQANGMNQGNALQSYLMRNQ